MWRYSDWGGEEVTAYVIYWQHSGLVYGWLWSVLRECLACVYERQEDFCVNKKWKIG